MQTSTQKLKVIESSIYTHPESIRALRFHFIGIGGIGVSAVARVLAERGALIQGSDVRESQLTLAIQQLGATVVIGHHPENIDGADLVVYSTAVPKDNLELQEAQKRGVPCIHRSRALAYGLVGLETVGITGTHGKGTVSAMITHGLITAEKDPTFIIGGLLNQYKTNARVGALPNRENPTGQVCYGVAEIDESDGSHLNLHPNHALVNHLEVDHLNYYEDLAAIITTMTRFLEDNPNLETVAINVADEGVRRMIDTIKLDHTLKVITYAAEGYYPSSEGSLDKVEYTARDVVDQGISVSFTAYHFDRVLGRIDLPIPGGYNAENAAGALAVMLGGLTLDFSACQHALNTFEGLENRFTVRQDQEITVVKDYLSHPTGMKRVLESAKRMEHRKIWSVFKPYRFTLMRYHGEDYAKAFTAADDVLITTMYAANEPSLPGIDTQWFVAQLRQFGNITHFVPDQSELIDFLDQRVQAGDLVFFFGGDDFFKMADEWMDQRAAARHNH
jgi:UDP-N-acetylmuramate--alanine ligase